MKSRLLWFSFLAPILLNVSCSSSSESESTNSSASASATENPEGLPMSEADIRTGPAPGVPIVSARTYVGGSATTRVTGSFEIDEDIPINKPASYSDGSMTWLQYGVSGAETPNFLLTISPDEVGMIVGRGKPTATAGATACKGSMNVAANSITGDYSCPGITSYDPRDGKMGQVNIDVRFAATSP